MIELQGLTPGRDIEIKITGLRPGEKLTETLVDVNEVARPRPPASWKPSAWPPLR
jgi:O-antigen biosynthesis protein WbqV